MDLIERMINNTIGLLGITYSEFDNKVGPRLLFSYPNGVISSETFETLSDYVIVGKHLCNKIIAIKTGIDINTYNCTYSYYHQCLLSLR